MSDWTLWASQRPTDTTLPYRWRIHRSMILGLALRPEWTEKMTLRGTLRENEYWPDCAHWTGWRNVVEDSLEWRVAQPDETHIHWGGLDLLPCPFTGKQPTITYKGRWIGAPAYHAEALYIKSWLVDSRWEDAAKMRDAWNRRAPGLTPSQPSV